jgi:DNA-binding CsgD family transcriptional regulator
MLPGGYNEVMQAQTREEFRVQVVRFIQRLGFETVTAMTVVDRGQGRSDRAVVDNTPNAYAQTYTDTPAALRDPVLLHCSQHTVPIIWDQSTYVKQGAADLWEQQAQFGYRTGIAMALHLPHGLHFVLGVDRDKALPNDAGELQRIVADLQLFAVHAQDAAARVLLPTAPQQERPRLTPRELEALRWTMEGKTAWEVGALMSITERTAVWHLNSAMHKMDCVNKHQAVVKALRFGLIR